MEPPRTLVFGFPPVDGASDKQRATTDLIGHLGAQAGLSLRAVFATDYRTLANDLVDGGIDVAWLGPLAVLRVGTGGIPSLIMRRAGRTTYHAALFARRDAGITSVSDLEGRRVGWVDEDSAAGYVFPRALIGADYPMVDVFLGEQRILGSHRAVVEAVLDGSVVAGATFVNFDEEDEIAVCGWYEHAGDRRDELESFAVTAPIPHDMIVVRASLAQGDRDAIIGALRALADDHEGQDLQMAVFNGSQGFASVEPSLLADLRDAAGRAGWRPR